MFLEKFTHSKLEAIIGPETEIEGNIRTSASIRIDGKVKGSIHAETVTIGPNGIILGDINAQNLTIGGRVKGNVAAQTILELLASGQILGDIKTSKLIIADGASFEGNCQMIKEEGKVVPMDDEDSEQSGHRHLKVISGNGKQR